MRHLAALCLALLAFPGRAQAPIPRIGFLGNTNAALEANLVMSVDRAGIRSEVECLDCGERAPMERALVRVRAGEVDPPCRTCGGILKSATISFGQNLVPEVMERARLEAQACDVLIASTNARFADTHARVGIYPGWGLSQKLSRMIGISRAKELLGGWEKGKVWRSADDPSIIYKAALHGTKKAIEVWTSNPDHW